MDIDAFFSSAARIINPEFKNTPIGISSGENKDVIASASYDARKFGIHAGMPVFKAKKLCPDIVFLRYDFQLYYSLFNKIFDFLSKYDNIIIEIATIDEFFIDVSNICITWDDARELAKKWQYLIRKEIQLNVSFGISFNKFAAKMATGLNKPYGISLITPESFQEKIWDMDISKFYGIGNKTSQKLKRIDVFKIKDLALLKYNDKDLMNIFGKNINKYINQANGIGETKLPIRKRKPKSISKSESFKDGLSSDMKFLKKKLKLFSEQISAFLSVNNYYALNIAVQFSHGKNIREKQSFTKQKKLKVPIYKTIDIYNNAIEIFDSVWKEEKIRSIGITANTLISKFNIIVQQNIFEESVHEEKTKINEIIDSVNYKFKEKVLKIPN